MPGHEESKFSGHNIINADNRQQLETDLAPEDLVQADGVINPAVTHAIRIKAETRSLVHDNPPPARPDEHMM